MLIQAALDKVIAGESLAAEEMHDNILPSVTHWIEIHTW